MSRLQREGKPDRMQLAHLRILASRTQIHDCAVTCQRCINDLIACGANTLSLLDLMEDIRGEVRGLARGYGAVEGSHHKAWVIDQIVRSVLGDEYEDWTNWYRTSAGTAWDKGIAP